MNSNFFNLRGMHMRIDLSREDETRMLPSNSVESDSMNAFQKELVERIGYRVQHNNYESFKEFFEFIFNNLEQFLPEPKTYENEVISDEFEPRELSLEDRLIKFDQEVIRKECPNTPGEYRLLRPEMLKMLIERQPVNLVEFGEKIPPYLRKPMQSLDTKSPDYQSRYIKDVVKIIEEYGDL